MEKPRHILIVDDDPVVLATLVGYFEAAGYFVSEARDGEQMLNLMTSRDIDLVILDINLPGEDGITLTRKLRGVSEIGIILITKRTDELDRIIGLEMGADDYIIKPFNPRELLARAKNLLRRTTGQVGFTKGRAKKHFSGWTLDLDKRELTSVDGEGVPLTRGEFDLLEAFALNPHRVLSRDFLLERTSRQDWVPSDRTIDVFVGRLRQKIEQNPKRPKILQTVHGVGYKLSADVI